jgi:hypothetical protein
LLKKWIPRLLIGAALLAVTSILLYRWLAAEPVYQGRPLRSWLDDLQQGSTLAERQRAAEVLKQIGPDGNKSTGTRPTRSARSGQVRSG